MHFALDHVAIGVRSAQEAGPRLAAWFGARPGDGGPSPGFGWYQWSFANGAVLELIEPAGADGFMHRFLERQGPGIHHVTFRVPSLAEAAIRAGDAGYEVVGYDDSQPSWKECFLHPRQAQGIVVQLAETSSVHPVTTSTQGAELRAVRLRAESEETARAQWEGLLGGELTKADGRLLFRWPDSPLTVAVRIAPDAEPGPEAVELAGADDGALDRAQVGALFGTPFELG